MNTKQFYEKQVREILFYEFDDFRLDVKRLELLKHGDPVSLTHKALQVLLILVQNFGQTVEKENIYQQLWPDSFVEDANLTQHIYVLRKTLGRNSLGESYIETVARSGYRFASDVKEIYPIFAAPFTEQAKSQSRVPSESHVGDFQEAVEKPYLTLLKNGVELPHRSERPVSDDAVAEQAPLGVRSRWRQPVFAVSLMAMIALPGLGIWLYVSRQKGQPPQNPQTRSIAILPFKPIGEESNNEKLGLGMADAVITRLGRLHSISVRPTSAVFHYTDSPPDSSLTAGHEMGVDAVLEGTVQRDTDRVRVSVTLINVSDGSTVWADNFDENFTNIFNVQDSISAKVVRALEISLSPQQENLLAEHSTTSTEASQAYQLGVYFGSSRTKEGMEKAVSYFQKAVDADPNYALAYGMVADTYNMLGYYGFADGYEMREKASAASQRALALDKDLPEALVAEAYLKINEQNGHGEAKLLLERALELAPNNSNAHVRYGWILIANRDLDGGVRQMRLAQEYDPLSTVSNVALCQVLVFQEKAEEGIKYCEKSAELSPDLETAQLALAEAYFAGGRHEEAIARAGKLVSKSAPGKRLSVLGSLGYFYAKLGHRPEAEKILTEFKSKAADQPFLLNDLVTINYALGSRDEGFAYFNQLYDKHMVGAMRFFYDPLWADVRADKRVMDRMKEP